MGYFEIDDRTDAERSHDAVAHEILLLMRAEPEQSWTIAELSARVHLSRAALARRFTKAFGHTPAPGSAEFGNGFCGRA
ncbi:hypothetical protein [Nocardia sp. NPDC056000]|uniref:hypothetical protein n=1 Tax=Nocardia sp. NPDC056000 TaxID=3345674 RepID=UPI0035DC7588